MAPRIFTQPWCRRPRLWRTRWLADALLTASTADMVVEAVKWAEDEEGFVVHLYKAERSGVQAEIAFSQPVRQVLETSMLEEGGHVLALRYGRVETWFRPFEIKTLGVAVA